MSDEERGGNGSAEDEVPAADVTADETSLRDDDKGRASEKESASVIFSANQVRRVRELLARFAGARRAVRFYPQAHPAITEAVAALMDTIAAYHAEGVDVPLTFFEDELLLGDQLLPEDSILFDQLIRDMTSIGATSVTFKRGLTVDELRRVLPVLAADERDVEKEGGLDAMAEHAAAPNAVVGAVTVLDHEQPDVDDREAGKVSYTGALDLLRELDSVVKKGGIVASDVRGVVRSLVDNVVHNRYAMLELSGLKDYDEYTFFHSVNVAILSLSLGSLISRDWRFLSSLGVGALLHDVGKLTVELEVLNKSEALTAEEWRQIRQHPLFGAEQAVVIPGLDKAATVVILEHHLRYDLSGYPQRSPARPQHLMSRIVAICDAYDAMTSRRSYSAARLQDQAVSILAKNMGTAFDPVLVRLFVRMIGAYPPSTTVALDSGEVAVVTRPSSDVVRPVVRVFADAHGALIPPFDIDLSDPAQAKRRMIESTVDPRELGVEVEHYLDAAPPSAPAPS